MDLKKHPAVWAERSPDGTEDLSCLSVLREGYEKKAFPSAAVAVGRGYDTYLSAVIGNKTTHPVPEAADRSTLYDMASLSKLMSTTMIALRLVEEGKLLLTDSLSMYFSI